ncbi:hypothetical protein BOX15_Mlig021217g1, partial [Macrostomum lignano]
RQQPGMREDKKSNSSSVGGGASNSPRIPLVAACNNTNSVGSSHNNHHHSHAKTPSDPAAAGSAAVSQQHRSGGGRVKRATLPISSSASTAVAQQQQQQANSIVSRSQENLGLRTATLSGRSASNSGNRGIQQPMKKSSSAQGIAPTPHSAAVATGGAGTNAAAGAASAVSASIICCSSTATAAAESVASDGAIAAASAGEPSSSSAAGLEREKSVRGAGSRGKAEAERLKAELEAAKAEAAAREARMAQLESECQRLRRSAAAAASAVPAATSPLADVPADVAAEAGGAAAEMRQRLAQMEEANFSATEELQATLLELAELQLRNTHLTDENENLVGEKQVLLESLYHQTESLDRSRRTVESLKSLLTSDIRRRTARLAERERQLLELLDIACAEKADALAARLESERQLESANAELREQLQQQHAQMADLRQQAKSDEIDRLKRDRLAIELEGRCNSLRREVARFKQMYESSKADFERLKELNSDDAVSTASELQSMLEQKEKLACELSRAQEELSRLDESNLQLTGQLQDLRLSAEKAASELRDQLQQQAQELQLAGEQRRNLAESLASQQTATADARAAAEAEADRAKRLEAELTESEAACESLRVRLAESEQKAAQELDEWRSYEQDLLRTVQVADDVKQEAEKLLSDWTRERSQLSEDNRKLMAELTSARSELEHLKSQLQQLQQQQLQQQQQQQQQQQRDFPSRELASTVGKELANMRALRKLEQRQAASTQVKSLIHSIEETVKRGPSPDSPPTAAAATAVADSVKTRRTSVPTVPLEQQQQQQQQLQQNPDQQQQPQQQQQLRHPLSRSGSSWGQSALIRCSYPNMSTTALESIRDESPSLSAQHDVTPPPLNPSASQLPQPLPQSSCQLRPSPAPASSSSVAAAPSGISTPAADPLAELAKRHGGSKRNGLLRWCQSCLAGYPHTEVTNFSSSWNDGMAMCGLLHRYLPDRVPYAQLTPEDKRGNFLVAFKAAESAGIKTTLSLDDMVSVERPDWNAVMSYVASIYVRFETAAG